MTDRASKQPANRQRSTILAVAWIVTLLASFLPDILWKELFAGDTSQALWLRMGVLLIGLALSLAWKAIRPLRGYFSILLVLLIVDGLLRPLIAENQAWVRWFGGESASWLLSNLGIHLLRLMAPLAILAVLAAMGLKRRDYYLVRGQLDAPAEPIRWLGLKQPEPWKRMGRNLAIIVSAVTLGFLLFGARPALNDFVRMLPLFPAVLLFAALNAFNEELPYRAALLSQLLSAVGKRHALLLTAVGFGLGHFYGVPSGVIGVLMAGFFGWLLGKSMVETKGFFWAWSIHFLQDVLIFSFMAMGAMAAGGA